MWIDLLAPEWRSPRCHFPVPPKAIALNPCSNKLNKSAKFVAQGMQPKAKLI
ncbi:hypothetical protein [Microcoleus sp.]|uniref:hypothetical protein n=1 Tax=Microcoleus sp. TaxID=44472 RepID=UPI0035948DF3